MRRPPLEISRRVSSIVTRCARDGFERAAYATLAARPLISEFPRSRAQFENSRTNPGKSPCPRQIHDRQPLIVASCG